MATPTQINLPAVLSENSAFSELSQASDNLVWLMPFVNSVVQIGESSLSQITAAKFVAMGVPGYLSNNLVRSVADWLLTSVGAVDSGLFVSDWPVSCKLLLAVRFLNKVVPFKGTYQGILNTLEIFEESTEVADPDFIHVAVLPEPGYRDMADTAPNHYSLDVHTPFLHLAYENLEEQPDRTALSFRTLEAILRFHNTYGSGDYWVDWLDTGADYSLAGDRCS